MTEETTFNLLCDGPACAEESPDGENWLTVITKAASDVALENKYANKHFHNEQCLLNYVGA